MSTREGGWGAVLRAPHSRGLLAATLVGRLPGCMCAVVLVLVVRHDHGSYVWAGGTVAAWRVAFSAGQPAMGRAVDRYGQTRPMIIGAAVSSAAYAAVAWPGVVTSPAGIVLVVVAGASSPPLEGGLRALWRHLVPVRHLPSAYSLDSACMQAGHILGPLLVVGCVAVAGPRAALVVMAVLGLTGALLVAASPPSRNWRPQPAADGMLTALRPRGMLLLLALFAGIGAVIGAVDVIGVDLSEQWHQAWLAGAVPAALPVGGILGSALYGYRAWSLPVRHQLLITAGLFVAGWLPLAAADGPASALLYVLLGGLAFGGLLTIAFQTVDVLAVDGMLRETYGWLIASMGASLAAGAAAAGALHRSVLLLLLPLAAAAVTAVLAAAVSHVLAAAPHDRRSLILLRGGATAPPSRDRDDVPGKEER